MLVKLVAYNLDYPLASDETNTNIKFSELWVIYFLTFPTFALSVAVVLPRVTILGRVRTRTKY